MPLAAILGVCLLLPWPQANLVAPATAVWQSAPVKENQPSNSPAQSSSAQQATEQQKGPDQSTTPSQPPAAAPSCPENSQPGSTAKPDCKLKQSTKTKKHHETHKAVAPAAPAPAGTTPEKKVVKNGGTDEPTVDLSSGVNQKQASEQAKRAEDTPCQQRCESEENLWPSTQCEPAGHGQANQELHGAGHGGQK